MSDETKILEAIDVFRKSGREITRTGLNGFLAPDGRFMKCAYAAHITFAPTVYRVHFKHANPPELHTLEDEDQATEFLSRHGYMALGSWGPGGGNMSHIRFPGIGATDLDKPMYMTPQQAKFLIDHIDELDEQQQIIFLECADAFCENHDVFKLAERACTCHIGNWESLACPKHGLDAKSVTKQEGDK